MSSFRPLVILVCIVDAILIALLLANWDEWVGQPNPCLTDTECEATK